MELSMVSPEIREFYLISLNSLTSTRPKSVSLSSGITGRARKERRANGAGGKLPRLAAVLSTISCWTTTTSR